MAEEIQLKPCPFCKGTNLDYSVSVASRTRTTVNYHMAIFCKDCFCYGRRVLIHATADQSKYEIARNYKKQASEAWNDR